MTVLICPGIHPPALTQSFLAALGRPPDRDLVFPADRYPAYSPYHIWQFLQAQREIQALENLLLIGFSAGVVGAVGVANLWQGFAGTVKALIALDGWGVPLAGSFPIYRISHDPFTHWSSGWLSSSDEGFYADPPVAHLELWRSPQNARGWQVIPENKGVSDSSPPLNLRSDFCPTRQRFNGTTAAHYLNHLLERYGEI